MSNFLKLAILNIIVVAFFGTITILISNYIKTNNFNYTLLLIGIAMVFIIIYLSKEIWYVYKSIRR